MAHRLNELLAGETVYSDAWSQDLSWLGKLYDLTEGQSDLWHVTKTNVIEELHLKRHRASSDALILLETYIRTRKE